MSIDYKQAGVDVHAGYKAVELMKKHIKKTGREEAISGIGGFGGLFTLAPFMGMQEPVLVSGTDGVGTKLKMAFVLDKHDTIGIDCVAMCVNDIVCSGAMPLFFLDYIACGKNYPERIAEIVGGIADGCVQSGAALIGGETAEMPGFYPVDEYDVAGFAVGIVDRPNIIDGSKIKAGDVLIGIQSSGIHSNGYSLVRKLFDPTPEKLNMYIDELGTTLGEELIKPTKIYVKMVRALLDAKVEIKGISHVTGGGFIENIPRMMPEHLIPSIKKGSWKVLPIFELMQKTGNIKERDMYNTYNMGIGMVMAMDESQVENALKIIASAGEVATVIGEVKAGTTGEIELC